MDKLLSVLILGALLLVLTGLVTTIWTTAVLQLAGSRRVGGQIPTSTVRTITAIATVAIAGVMGATWFISTTALFRSVVIGPWAK